MKYKVLVVFIVGYAACRTGRPPEPPPPPIWFVPSSKEEGDFVALVQRLSHRAALQPDSILQAIGHPAPMASERPKPPAGEMVFEGANLGHGYIKELRIRYYRPKQYANVRIEINTNNLCMNTDSFIDVLVQYGQKLEMPKINFHMSHKYSMLFQYEQDQVIGNFYFEQTAKECLIEAYLEPAEKRP